VGPGEREGICAAAVAWLAVTAAPQYAPTMTSTAELRVELPLSLGPEEARLFMALKGFEMGRLTLGQAAKLAGHSKRAFMDVLGQHHIPVMNYPAEELEREVNP